MGIFLGKIKGTKLNHETLVVRASCPLYMYLITPGSTVNWVSIIYNYTLIN